MKRFNGEISCPIHEEWEEHKSTVNDILDKVGQMQELIMSQEKYLPHLEKLDSIARSNIQACEYLVGVATGKDQVPMKVVMRIVNVFAIVIIGLVLVIGTLLTGEHFGLIRELFR